MSRTTDAVLETQLQAWLDEGFTTDDILAQAQHNWPGIAADRIHQLLNRLLAEPGVDDETPQVSLLHFIHLKRMQEIERLELRLQESDCPLAVHTLYRGLLRDVETFCMKAGSLPHVTPLGKPSRRPAKMKYHDEPEMEPIFPIEEPSRKPVSTRNSLACLLGFILPWLATGCSCLLWTSVLTIPGDDTSRNNTERHYQNNTAVPHESFLSPEQFDSSSPSVVLQSARYDRPPTPGELLRCYHGNSYLSSGCWVC